MNMIKVAINGFGTIGKRVADAIDAQDDMKVIGVTKQDLLLDVVLLKNEVFHCIVPLMMKKK